MLNADGTFTYTPAANYSGPDGFSYKANDGTVDSGPAVVSITVSNANDGPVAVNDTATTPEDTSVTTAVLANDTDGDGDTLSVSSVTTPAHGGAVINPDKTITYTPAANYNGADSFSYTIGDGHAGIATATVNVTVTAVNDGPVAVNDTATTVEDTAATIAVLANDSDVDGDILTVSSVTVPAHGTAVINPDKTILYTPTANYSGADSFSYTIGDGHAGIATATVNVTVTAVNDGPVAVNDTATTAEDTAATITVLANDSDLDGDILAVSNVTVPAHGTAAINADKTIAYTPAANYNGADSFSYTIGDGNSGTATATVNVTVTPANDGPVAVNDTATTVEDTAATITVLANDSDLDGDILAVSTVTVPAHGTAAINADKTIAYTPAANYNGADSFSYTIGDGNGGTATATVNVTVTPANDGPVAVNDTATTVEDTAATITVLANDSDLDGDTLSVSSVTVPAHGTAAINADKTIAYTPAANYNGADSFSYTIGDGNGGTATATVNVTVTPANDGPVAVNDTATTVEDTAATITVLANDSDLDGDILAVSSVTVPAHGTAAINADKTIAYTPAANYNGADSFSYTIGDGNGGTATATVNVTVTPANDGPVAVNDTATTVEDTAVNIAVLPNDTDLDGDALTVSSGDGAGARHGRDQRRQDDRLHAGGELQRRGQLQLHDRGQQRRDGDGHGQRDGDARERWPGCGQRHGDDGRGHRGDDYGSRQRQRPGRRHPRGEQRDGAGARHGRDQRRQDDRLHAGGELQRRRQLQLHDRGRQRRDGDGHGHRDGDARERWPGCRERHGDDGRRTPRRRSRSSPTTPISTATR